MRWFFCLFVLGCSTLSEKRKRENRENCKKEYALFNHKKEHILKTERVLFDHKKEHALFDYKKENKILKESKKLTAEDFKKLCPFDFEKEAVKYIGGTPNKKQRGDGGIDGRLTCDKTSIPIQVKKYKGRIGVDTLRDFYEPIKKHGRGIFITLNGYTKNAKEKANSWLKEGLDVQLLTIEDIVAGSFQKCSVAAGFK